MQKFNKYSRNLFISTVLYILVQILYSWRMDGTGKAQLYAVLSALIVAGNVFFIIRLNNRFTGQLLKVFNSYLLVSTFGFYLTYCLKAALISPDSQVLGTPFILEIILLVTLLFNAWQIIIYSREIKAADKKNTGGKKTLFNEIFSWVDALLSAVIFVLLINIFLIQIYSIPSESMFPVFFVKDRPVVDKITRGPSLPFTRFRIPPLQKIHRGDIVTFRNPKYEKTVDSELKHLLSQFLYMITFTTVNIDRYDENGNEKADPLVKRVVGLPGEQIQIINDVIYYRKSLSDRFEVLDENIHSRTDLYTLPQSTLARLQYLPIDKTTREILTIWDKDISSLDREAAGKNIAAARAESEQIRGRLLEGYLQAVRGVMENKHTRIEKGDISTDLGYNPFQKIENLRDDNVNFIYNLDDEKLWDRGWNFLSTESSGEGGEFFSIASATDLKYKSIVSQWILDNLRYMEAVFTNSPSDTAEKGLNDDETELGEFLTYILRYYDFRNLPPFPSDSLIEKDHYFVMGDNRYNSLDLRHGLKPADRFFVGTDKNSFVHKSYLKPVTIDEKWIEGFVAFRLFPLGRIGIPE